MSSSESEYEENPSNQESEKEKNGDEKEAVTNGQDDDKPVTWNDLVSAVKYIFKRLICWLD